MCSFLNMVCHPSTRLLTRSNLLRSATTIQPTVSIPEYRGHRGHRDCKEIYMLLMLDLSISNENLPASLTYAHTVHGLGANRTTYLHWLQGNLTHAPRSNNLVPLPNAETIAPYISPSPNPGDIPHTYAFYLFRQPKGFTLTGINAGRDLYSTSLTATDRIGFDVQDVADERGVELVAGTYLREQAP